MKGSPLGLFLCLDVTTRRARARARTRGDGGGGIQHRLRTVPHNCGGRDSPPVVCTFRSGHRRRQGVRARARAGQYADVDRQGDGGVGEGEDNDDDGVYRYGGIDTEVTGGNWRLDTGVGPVGMATRGTS